MHYLASPEKTTTFVVKDSAEALMVHHVAHFYLDNQELRDKTDRLLESVATNEMAPWLEVFSGDEADLLLTGFANVLEKLAPEAATSWRHAQVLYMLNEYYGAVE